MTVSTSPPWLLQWRGCVGFENSTIVIGEAGKRSRKRRIDMTPKEHDQLVAALAENERFIADQYARLRLLTASLLRLQRFRQTGGGNGVEFANLIDGTADLLRFERKVLREKRRIRRLGEDILTGRIPG